MHCSIAPIELVKLCILCFCFLQDRDVRIGVFPEREEIIVGSFGFGSVALQRVGARETYISEGSDRRVQHNPTVAEDFLNSTAASRP